MLFNLIHQDSQTQARAGVFDTAHGTVETPVFMPVGTAGSVKGIHVDTLKDDIGAQIILSNTYHLFLRPGTAVIEGAGGLHRFCGWHGPMLTDSGGFQVFSLTDIRKLTEVGVKFQSHIDGSRHLFTSESVIDIQRSIGADIIMAFDECAPGDASYEYARKALGLTQRWLDRCINRMEQTRPLYGYEQSLFPIVQGGAYADLREQAARHIIDIPADGYAIGGLAVGEPEEVMYRIIEVVNPILPADKPRYLMGVGTPANLLEAIERGVDMFDCTMPTRNGRNGMLFTANGMINIKNHKWIDDFSPIDPDGDSFVDHAYSKAFLRHLIIAGEMLGSQIASRHNLAFYRRLVCEARRQILADNFAAWKSEIIEKLSQRL
ncbi:MAG: tRNA guanosine(34) transglycosylase Tgt [Bacteroidales bacterium]|jgi:queuine tRNA-ribosyltransferase|nr:tRNA guanosine(34) transglycosylase Tgt [Bacteroidales bacterium]